MIPEERKAKILQYVNERGSAKVSELMEVFEASEATIRRDLTEMDARGLLNKVHGGAFAIDERVVGDSRVAEKEERYRDEKIMIAKYAASLISDNDIVFLDAGTTTQHVIDYVTALNVTFVTNAPAHANKLASMGYDVYMIGGKLKQTTEAMIGSVAYEQVRKYQFSIAFVGANAVNHKAGFTTPDPEEAMIKECALRHSSMPYVLCDHTKFSKTSAVTFAKFEDVCAVTCGQIPESYINDSNIINLMEE